MERPLSGTTSGRRTVRVQSDFRQLYKTVVYDLRSHWPGMGVDLFTPLTVTYADKGSYMVSVSHAGLKAISFPIYTRCDRCPCRIAVACSSSLTTVSKLMISQVIYIATVSEFYFTNENIRYGVSPSACR